MRIVSMIMVIASALQITSLRAELSPAEVQAGKIHQAFEKAKLAQKKKPVNIEKELASEPSVGETIQGQQLSDLNPADRRGSTPTPVQNAQDAVSRPAPQ